MNRLFALPAASLPMVRDCPLDTPFVSGVMVVLLTLMVETNPLSLRGAFVFEAMPVESEYTSTKLLASA